MAKKKTGRRIDRAPGPPPRVERPALYHVGVRAERSWIRSVDRWAREHRVTRSEAVRELVLAGLGEA